MVQRMHLTLFAHSSACAHTHTQYVVPYHVDHVHIYELRESSQCSLDVGLTHRTGEGPERLKYLLQA